MKEKTFLPIIVALAALALIVVLTSCEKDKTSIVEEDLNGFRLNLPQHHFSPEVQAKRLIPGVYCLCMANQGWVATGMRGGSSLAVFVGFWARFLCK